MAALPNKQFWVNWNARNYDSATHTISKEPGQLFSEDLVLRNAAQTYTDTYVTIDSSNTSIVFNFNSTADNPFNRTSATATMTIIAKTKSTSSGQWCFSNINRSNGRVGWMVMPGTNTYQMAYIGDSYDYTSNTEPMIIAWRNGNGTMQYISISDNVTGTPYSSTSWVGQETTKFVVFGSEGGYNWYGDFYWVYISPEVLTDAEIQAVIDYNESLTVFEPSQDTFTFSGNGGTQTFTVEADNAWTCAAPTDFTISPMSGTAGTTTVTITAPSRISTISETITFTDAQSNTFDITITQSDQNITPNLTMYRGSTTIKKMYYGTDLVYRKMAHSPSLTLSVDSLSIDPNGGNGTFTVTTDGRFTVSTEDSWLTLSTSGTTVTVTATSTSANRSGSVLVTDTNGFVTKTATVAVNQSVATLVSYIHTTSTTWNKDYVIDTGIIADPTTTMRVKYLGKGVGSDRVIGYDWMDTGAYEVGWRFFDVFSNTNTLDINNKRYQYGSPMKNNNTVYNITTGNAFIYDNINETYVINKTAEGSLLQPHSILVDVGTRYVAEVEIVQNGTTVFFGKAAVDDNIIGLYDTVSGTMKYNPDLTMAYDA